MQSKILFFEYTQLNLKYHHYIIKVERDPKQRYTLVGQNPVRPDAGTPEPVGSAPPPTTSTLV